MKFLFALLLLMYRVDVSYSQPQNLRSRKCISQTSEYFKKIDNTINFNGIQLGENYTTLRDSLKIGWLRKVANSEQLEFGPIGNTHLILFLLSHLPILYIKL